MRKSEPSKIKLDEMSRRVIKKLSITSPDVSTHLRPVAASAYRTTGDPMKAYTRHRCAARVLESRASDRLRHWARLFSLGRDSDSRRDWQARTLHSVQRGR